MNKIDTVLFDMDGVASDWRTFTSSFLFQKYGIDLEEKGFDWFNKHSDCDMWVKTMYHENVRMFYELDMISRFEELFDGTVQLCSSQDIKIGWLSAIDMRHPYIPTVIYDKMKWIENNIHKKFPSVNTILNTRFAYGSHDKVTFAKPNVLLIDDYKKNTLAFEEAGGKAILLDAEDGNYDVESALNQLAQFLQGHNHAA